MNEITKGMENFFGRGKFEIKPFADGVCCYIGSFGNVGVVETDEENILFIHMGISTIVLVMPLLLKKLRERIGKCPK